MELQQLQQQLDEYDGKFCDEILEICKKYKLRLKKITSNCYHLVFGHPEKWLAAIATTGERYYYYVPECNRKNGEVPPNFPTLLEAVRDVLEKITHPKFDLGYICYYKIVPYEPCIAERPFIEFAARRL